MGKDEVSVGQDLPSVRAGDCSGGAKGLRYVFVLTYGRTGSTLVQGILNSIPGYVIRGENAGGLQALFPWWRDFSRRLETTINLDRAQYPTHPWFGSSEVSSSSLAQEIRSFVLEAILKPPPGTRVTGFKEIRWWKYDLVELVEFVQQVFPGARFILLTRDHSEVMKSKWFAQGDPVKVAATLAGYEERMTLAGHALGDEAFRLHYNNFVNDRDSLQSLFDWLGEEWVRSRVDGVMDRKHSY